MSEETKAVQYKALKDFEIGPEESHVKYEAGAIFEVSALLEPELEALLADGTIEVVAPAEEKKEDAPAEEAATAPAEKAAPVTPKKYYRNSLIVEEAPRTVGAQTFQHIKTVEGHEFDLTQEEYSKDVTVQ